MKERETHTQNRIYVKRQKKVRNSPDKERNQNVHAYYYLGKNRSWQSRVAQIIILHVSGGIRKNWGIFVACCMCGGVVGCEQSFNEQVEEKNSK